VVAEDSCFSQEEIVAGGGKGGSSGC